MYASGTQGRFVTQDAALLSAAAARVRRRTVKRFLERGILHRYHKRHPDAPDVRKGSTIKVDM